MSRCTINVSKDFTIKPMSFDEGKRFQEQLLIPAINKYRYSIDVELDGTIGYSTAFLKGAFESLSNNQFDSLTLISKQDPLLIEEIFAIRKTNNTKYMQFFDKCGKLIKKDDWIVYGHNLGRCAGLRYGKVLEIIKGRSIGYSYRSPESTTKIRVQGVDDDWNTDKPKLIKKSIINFSKRILVINEKQIPKNIIDLFKENK